MCVCVFSIHIKMSTLEELYHGLSEAVQPSSSGLSPALNREIQRTTNNCCYNNVHLLDEATFSSERLYAAIFLASLKPRVESNYGHFTCAVQYKNDPDKGIVYFNSLGYYTHYDPALRDQQSKGGGGGSGGLKTQWLHGAFYNPTEGWQFQSGENSNVCALWVIAFIKKANSLTSVSELLNIGQPIPHYFPDPPVKAVKNPDQAPIIHKLITNKQTQTNDQWVMSHYANYAPAADFIIN